MSEEHAIYDTLTARVDQLSKDFIESHDELSREVSVIKGLLTNQAAPEPQHDKLFAALAVAQGEIQSAIADKENKHFNYKYADLDACWNACRKPLADNELTIIQMPSNVEGGGIMMRTVLGHSSGQSISAVYTMYPDKTTPQAIASCMTYLRRYMLCAMVGISQEDDDATLASPDPDEYQRISKMQVDEILVLADNLFKKSADAVVARMLSKVFQVTAVQDIPADLFDQAKTLLQNQAKREKEAAEKKEK